MKGEPGKAEDFILARGGRGRRAAGELDDGPQCSAALLWRRRKIPVPAFAAGGEVRAALVIHRYNAARRERKRARANRIEHCGRVPHGPVVGHLHVIAIRFGERVIRDVIVVVKNTGGRVKDTFADLISAGDNRASAIQQIVSWPMGYRFRCCIRACPRGTRRPLVIGGAPSVLPARHRPWNRAGAPDWC